MDSLYMRGRASKACHNPPHRQDKHKYQGALGEITEWGRPDACVDVSVSQTGHSAPICPER